MKAFLCLILIALTTQMHADDPLDVSMVQLIAAPEKFHSKFVRVIGYLHLEFEGNGLFLHREDYLAGISANGIWFGGTLETNKKPQDFTDQYVLVEGTFNAEDRGHMNMWSGSISDLKRVMPWRKIPRNTSPKDDNHRSA